MIKRHKAYIITALVAVAIIGFCFIFTEVIYLLFGALVFAYLIGPMVAHFQKKGMPKVGSIALSYCIIGVIILFFIFVVLPLIYREGVTLLNSSDVFFQHFAHIWQVVTGKIEEVLSLSYIIQWEADILPLIEAKVGQFSDALLAGLMDLPKDLSYLLLAPVIAYYFLRDSNTFGGSLLTMFPPNRRSDVLILAKETDRVIRSFIRGNLLVSLAVAIVTWAGLWLIGVDYPLVLGALNGILDIIPYFGPVLGAVPVLLFALLQGDVNILWVVVLLLAVQQMENIFISPRVIGDSVGLHPVTIILLVFLGGSIGGILGMVLVIPIAAVAKVLLNFFYEGFVGYRFH